MYLTLKIVFTFSLISFVIAQNNLISPCPRLFQYETDSREPDKWYGTLKMMTDYDTFGNFAQIYLDRPALQLGNWYGVVYTVNNMIYSIAHEEDQLKANDTKLVRFFVRYDPAEPPPKLIAYNFNTKRVCPEGAKDFEGAPAESTTQSLNLYTSIDLGSTPKPPRVEATGNKTGGGHFLVGAGDISESTTQSLQLQTSIILDFTPNVPQSEASSNKPAVGTNSQTDKEENFYISNLHALLDPLSIADIEESSVNDICGKIVIPAKPLVTFGQPTREGEFPWHVALYHVNGNNSKYICGGSLISKDFIITAAHCVTKLRSSKPLKPSNLKVYLGKHFLRSFSNDGIQHRQLSEIIVHPQYNGGNYSHDIALLKLSLPAEFTDYVRPICLWQESPELNSIVEKQGKVVGWGYDETGELTEQLMQVEMPVVSVSTCLYSYPEFFSRFVTENNFCAGLRNGTSVCSGDSGGGMVFPKSNSSPKKPVWQLRGLVSISAASQNNYKCDSSHFVVFTDTAKYLKWIRNKIFK